MGSEHQVRDYVEEQKRARVSKIKKYKKKMPALESAGDL